MKLKVIIHPAEEGWYWAEVPGFPGCVSEGDTLEQVRRNIKEAFEGVLAVLQEQAPLHPDDRTAMDCVEEVDL